LDNCSSNKSRLQDCKHIDNCISTLKHNLYRFGHIRLPLCRQGSLGLYNLDYLCSYCKKYEKNIKMFE